MAEKKYRVYKYQNKIVPTAYYVGKTSYKYQSNRAGKNGLHYVNDCPKFGKAIIEYGWPNFEYSVLADNLTKEEAERLEQYYIEYYDSINQGYNVSIGGAGPLGVHHSDETRKKMSVVHLNDPSHSKPVIQFTKGGKLKANYPSAHEASRQTGVSQCGISLCCSGTRKSAGKYIWRYAP